MGSRPNTVPGRHDNRKRGVDFLPRFEPRFEHVGGLLLHHGFTDKFGKFQAFPPSRERLGSTGSQARKRTPRGDEIPRKPSKGSGVAMFGGASPSAAPVTSSSATDGRRAAAGEAPEALTLPAQGLILDEQDMEIVRSFESLRTTREELNRQIAEEEQEKAGIEEALAILQERLRVTNTALKGHTKERRNHDKAIQEMESAHKQIVESSQTLLHVLKKEHVNLARRHGTGGEKSPRHHRDRARGERERAGTDDSKLTEGRSAERRDGSS